MRVRFEDNASPDIAEAAKENYIVIVPLGCTEQHGPHLPVGCDLGRPIEAAERALEKHGAKVLVLPVLPFGTAAEHVAFAGTISLSFGTWSAVVVEILKNLVRDGFRRIVVTKNCGGHMGIEGPVYEFFCHAKRQIRELDVRIFGEEGWAELVKVVSESRIANAEDVHAGGIETSMMLAGRPELVHMDRLKKPTKHKRPWHGAWWIAEDITDTGATGDPTQCDAELGRKFGDRLRDVLCDFLGKMWRQPDGKAPPDQTGTD